jgi:hypothetical protein
MMTGILTFPWPQAFAKDLQAYGYTYARFKQA